MTDAWKLSSKVTYQNEGIFKTKQIEEDKFLMHLPRKKQIATLDMNLNDLDKTYTFPKEIQAIEEFTINEEHCVAAGSKSGEIFIKNTSQEQQTYTLAPSEHNLNRLGYINDMLFLPDNRLVNIYNNGAIAIWNLTNLSNNLETSSFKRIHQTFTYKIRQATPETILTCCNDGIVSLFDLEYSKVIDLFEHQSGIWCPYPLTSHVFCAAGLINQLAFWDARQHRIIQHCQLQNEETSFVTRLDPFRLIFGDGKQLCTCDVRKPLKIPFGNVEMKTSTETILVNTDWVIVSGRGGDLCKFIESEEEVEVHERAVGHTQNIFNILHLQAQQLANAINNHGMLQNLNGLINELQAEVFGHIQEQFMNVDEQQLQDIELQEQQQEDILEEQQQNLFEEQLDHQDNVPLQQPNEINQNPYVQLGQSSEEQLLSDSHSNDQEDS